MEQNRNHRAILILLAACVSFLVIGCAATTECTKVEDGSEEAFVEDESGCKGRTTQGIRKTVTCYLADLRYLYKKELKRNPSVKGEITVKFEISPSGRVNCVVLVSSNLHTPSLEHAIVRNIKKWRFPAIPEECGCVTATYPFFFFPEP